MPAGTPLETSDAVVREVLQGVLIEQGSGYFRTTTGIAGFYLDDTYKPVWGRQHATVFAELPALADRAFSDPPAHLEDTRELLAKHFEVEISTSYSPEGSPLHLAHISAYRRELPTVSISLSSQATSGVDT